MRLLRVPSTTFVFAAAAACAACAAFTVSAGPGVAATCPPPPSTEQPFLQWNDDHDYVLTTGGAFNAGAPAWSTQGGASVAGDHALFLPAGASATSPCTTAPHIVGIVRFFARAASPGAELKVEVLVKGQTYLAGTVKAGSDWAPGPMLSTNAPAYKGAVAYQVRLTAIGAAFSVDDVYLDPYSSK